MTGEIRVSSVTSFASSASPEADAKMVMREMIIRNITIIHSTLSPLTLSKKFQSFPLVFPLFAASVVIYLCLRYPVKDS